MASNATFFWTNQLSDADLAASDEAGDGVVGNLLKTQLRRAWRALGSAAWFTADYGTTRPVRVLALLGVSLGASATLRWRLSTTAAHDGDVHDTGTIAAGARGTLDGRKQCLVILPADKSARFSKVDLEDPGAGSIDCGFAAQAPWFQPQRNYSLGFADGVESATVQEEALGGSIYSLKRPKARVKRFSLNFLTPAEAAAQGVEITERAGVSAMFGMIPNPDSADAAAEMLVGQLRDFGETAAPSVKFRQRNFVLREFV